jgi:hypothetical protein
MEGGLGGPRRRVMVGSHDHQGCNEIFGDAAAWSGITGVWPRAGLT